MKKMQRMGRLAAMGLMLSVTGGCEVVSSWFNKSCSNQTCCPHTDHAHGAVAESQQSQASNDTVVVRIEGVPVGTRSEFLQFAQDFIRATPLAQFGLTDYDSAPAPIKDQLFNAYVEQKLVARWACDENVANSAEYREMLAKITARVEQELMAKTFEKRIFDTISVEETEVLAAYDKDREQMVKQPGSLTVIGAGFTSGEKAADFQRSLQVSGAESFESLAKDAGAHFKEFGKISTDPRMAFSSPLPPAARAVVFALPAHEHVARAVDGQTHWVLLVTDRIAPLHYSFDEIKDQLTTRVKAQKFMQEREKELQILRDRYTVDSDTSSLKKASANDLMAAFGADAQGEGGDENMQEELARLVGELSQAQEDVGELAELAEAAEAAGQVE